MSEIVTNKATRNAPHEDNQPLTPEEYALLKEEIAKSSFLSQINSELIVSQNFFVKNTK